MKMWWVGQIFSTLKYSIIVQITWRNTHVYLTLAAQLKYWGNGQKNHTNLWIARVIESIDCWIWSRSVNCVHINLILMGLLLNSFMKRNQELNWFFLVRLLFKYNIQNIKYWYYQIFNDIRFIDWFCIQCVEHFHWPKDFFFL